jgi:hypothetical protein
MKLKSVKSDDLTNGIVQVLGVGLGLMLPNIVANAIAKVDEGAVATDEQKTKKMYVNVGFAGLGTYGSLALEGKDTLTTFMKSLSLGASGGAVKGVAQHFFEKPVQAMPTGMAKSMLASGLGCPCNEPMASYPALQMPRYEMPAYESRNESKVLSIVGFESNVDLAM